MSYSLAIFSGQAMEQGTEAVWECSFNVLETSLTKAVSSTEKVKFNTGFQKKLSLCQLVYINSLPVHPYPSPGHFYRQ